MKPETLRDIVKLLEENGFVLIRSTSHAIYACGGVRIAIAHQRIVSMGVMRSVHKAIRQSKSEFQKEA